MRTDARPRVPRLVKAPIEHWRSFLSRHTANDPQLLSPQGNPWRAVDAWEAANAEVAASRSQLPTPDDDTGTTHDANVVSATPVSSDDPNTSIWKCDSPSIALELAQAIELAIASASPVVVVEEAWKKENLVMKPGASSMVKLSHIVTCMKENAIVVRRGNR